MKKLISLFLCLLLLAALAVPVLADTEPEEEVTASEEVLEWDSSYITFETFPVEALEGIEGAIQFYYNPEDGTYELPVDENGVIQWEDSTLTIGAIPDGENYAFGEYYIQQEIIPEDDILGSAATGTLAEPATRSASWVGLIAVIICAVLLGLAILIFVAAIVILLIVLIVSLVKKKKNSKAKEG